MNNKEVNLTHGNRFYLGFKFVSLGYIAIIQWGNSINSVMPLIDKNKQPVDSKLCFSSYT